MITLNKSMIILPHDEMIEKLKQTRIQRMLLCKDLNQYIGTNQINYNLKRNENGKPILDLKQLDGMVIQIQNQKIYDTLMQLYECGSWKWYSEKLPTEFNAWKNNQENNMNITAKKNFIYSFAFKHAQNFNLKIITPKEFYELQEPEITQEIIQEINEWFEINKPNRESKG
ncbi:MAG: hypothetical protein QT05_C0051G0047 [archaeon GW2011_AR13]|nr:MAG: hypothetical protein QT05_C0051G0047 [archaeon GW2011_AR13]HIG94876.1 hypothetical protein [Nanoarchaeota archaeon]HIH63624.1 hypothetical protein [Nanoarchaeota archaeon]HIJ10121.1 hypothetical protein [Nanoarchaeota archaeon]